MATRSCSVVATAPRAVVAVMALACTTITGCGQKGPLTVMQGAPALAAASAVPPPLPLSPAAPLPAPVPR